MHAVRVYKYIQGETMNKIKINSEISANFGFYVGHLTSILKVGLLCLDLDIFWLNVSKYLKTIFIKYSSQFRSSIMMDSIEIICGL